MKRSNVAYTSILILLVVGIGSAYLYSNSSYHAIVRIDFNVTVYAYPLGDYAYVTSYALVINFTRLYVVPPIGGNEPAPISYGKGQLNKSLNMGVNVTWLSAANQALFSSKNFFIAFAPFTSRPPPSRDVWATAPWSARMATFPPCQD